MFFNKSADAAAQRANSKTPIRSTNEGPTLRTNSPPLSVTPPQPPISPIASAAARRNPTSTNSPAASYRGADQMRKLTVGRDISLNGEITTCDHLVVEGTVKATIKGGKMLDITENGAFSGTVDIEQADIAGHFDGDLTVRGKLIIRATAMVTGVLRYAKLQIDTGAQVNGQLETLAVETYVTNTETATTETQASFGLAALNDSPGFLKATL